MAPQHDVLVLEGATAPTLQLGASRHVVARPIFIVDPDADARRLVGQCLTTLGLTNPTVELRDTDELTEELQRCLEQGAAHLPVLVVLDHLLSGSAGLRAVRWIRETPTLAEIPVVILSTSDGAEGVVEAYGLGVRSYLVKPVGFEALGAVVRDLRLPWMLT